MENIDIKKLKRSDIDKNQELKNKILLFITINKIDLDWISNYKQIIYHYVNNMTVVPKCYCGKFNNFKSFRMGYRKTCSQNCSNKSLNKKIKISETKLEKYGDKNYNNQNKIKETKKERYGDENYNNREKAFKTNEIRYGSYSAMKNEDVIKLVKLTKLERYGDPNYNNVESTKEFWKNIDECYKRMFVEKIKKSKLEMHGDENYNNACKMKETKNDKYGFYYVNRDKAIKTMVENGDMIPEELLSDWQIYRRKVNKITYKFKKKLYESWNGYDYYDKEFIKGYFSYDQTHRFYPTIDHKISVFYGFVNEINPDIIGNIDNLCITKRYINSIKKSLIEEEFLKSILNGDRSI